MVAIEMGLVAACWPRADVGTKPEAARGWTGYPAVTVLWWQKATMVLARSLPQRRSPGRRWAARF